MTTIAPAARAAVRIRVSGVVQGVGFRPFVHRLAIRHRLAGWVLNSAGDVQIEVQGEPGEVDAFLRELRTEAPPLARIEHVDADPCAPSEVVRFTIRESQDEPDRRQPVSPDVAMCGACERELFNLANRRYRYPFITCTDCGPRFTVIDAMPYDRERTSMRAFTQCAQCLREYRSPGDRRYHSETNSCPACGPRLWLESSDHPALALGVRESSETIRAASELLCAGKIVAIRGLGGFHLAVDATNDAAVTRLRTRKHREAKPLAVMVRTLTEARYVAQVSPAEAKLLTSPERPIVLLRRLTDPQREPGLAPSVAPGLDTIGVMLAYTSLHHLVLDRVKRPLVMTSGNRSEEPIATENDDARTRLAGIADAFLFHDRDIVSRYDDSVVRVAGETTVCLRRARGYAPLPVDLPFESPQALVAVGPHLKNTFTLVHGRRGYVSQHIGDLENLETLEHFTATLESYKRLFRIEPEVAVRDLHPGYLSTRAAGDLGLERIIAVQHHHAHVAAVLAEHGVTETAVGVAYDGTGYGADGNVWGAEILVADLAGYRRAAHLRYAPLPGGDLAARRPWRVAAGYVSLEPAFMPAFTRAFEGVDARKQMAVARQLEVGLNAPLASSMGRLFDAAAAVLGVRRVADYEAQAAMELEALAGTRPAQPLPVPITGDGTAGWVVDPVPLLAALGERLAAGADVRDLAAVVPRECRRGDGRARRASRRIGPDAPRGPQWRLFPERPSLHLAPGAPRSARAARARAPAPRAERRRRELRPSRRSRRFAETGTRTVRRVSR